jgi:hypothetical protein
MRTFGSRRRPIVIATAERNMLATLKPTTNRTGSTDWSEKGLAPAGSRRKYKAGKIAAIATMLAAINQTNNAKLPGRAGALSSSVTSASSRDRMDSLTYTRAMNNWAHAKTPLDLSIGGVFWVSLSRKRRSDKINLAIPTFALVGTIIGPESLTAVFGMGTDASRIATPSLLTN